MPRVIVARHGQTEFNQTGIIMGRSDSSLTVEGIITLRQLGSTLEQDNVRALFCSPLGRAVASARVYAEYVSCVPQLRPALAELSCGDWERRPREQVTGGESRIRKMWLDSPPAGESYNDAEERVASLISEVRSLDSLGTIMLVGHAGVNRVFLKLWLNLDPVAAVLISCPHDVIYVIEKDATAFARWSTGQELIGLLFDPE